MTDRSTRTADERPDSPVQVADESNLDGFRTGADRVVVEFYTDGCGICQSMEPVLWNLARELDIAVGQVNPRDDPPLVERFDVRSVPLFVLFLDGTPVARLADGFVPGDRLEAWVEQNSR